MKLGGPDRLEAYPTLVFRLNQQPARSEGDAVFYSLAIKNLSTQVFQRVEENPCFNAMFAYTSPYFHDLETVRTLFFSDVGPVPHRCVAPVHQDEVLHYTAPCAAPELPAEGQVAKLWPLIAVQSVGGKCLMAHARANANWVGGNRHYHCLHLKQQWENVGPGQEVVAEGRLYLMVGTVDELVRRYRSDFSGKAVQP